MRSTGARSVLFGVLWPCLQLGTIAASVGWEISNSENQLDSYVFTVKDFTNQ